MDSSLGHCSICEPTFSVPTHHNLRQTGPNGFMRYVFKHDNWRMFVRNVDNELELENRTCHGLVPTFGVVWLGTCLEE
jgi:hypothetical protein